MRSIVKSQMFIQYQVSKKLLTSMPQTISNFKEVKKDDLDA